MSSQPDLSEFHAISKPKMFACPVRAALDKLDKSEQAQLTAACESQQNVITNAAIAEWLKRRGHVITWQSIRSHRTGVCRCD